MAQKVLLIEDNELVRETLAEILILNGLEVIQACNGEVGLEKLKSQRPSLVVSDITMPVMDGYEVIRQIRNNPDTELIPVFLLTARGDIESKIKGLELGANDYISKPFESKELLWKIFNTLDQYDKLKRQSGASSEGAESFHPSDKGFLKKLNLLIEEQIQHSDINVEMLAEKLFISSSTFQRKIKKLTKQTPVKYILIYRLEKARNLILTDNGTLSQIAYKTGFGSLSYFSTSYKKHFGNNPKKDFPR